MEPILNLTQHEPTQAQIEAGVVCKNMDYVRKLLTFDERPSSAKIANVAEELAEFASASGYKSAMIGGALFLMAPLAEALLDVGITPLFSFTKRVSHEVDGVKTSVFEHYGFVEAV